MKKIVFLLMLAIFSLIVLFESLSAISLNKKTAFVSISTNQPASSITIKTPTSTASLAGGTKKVRLYPGTYQITASDGSSIASQSITLSAKEITSVHLVLTKSIMGSVLINNTQAIDLVSLMDHLPFYGPAYNYLINYQLVGRGHQKFLLKITAPTKPQQAQAITWLKGLGYNTSRLNIVYYTSPVNF